MTKFSRGFRKKLNMSFFFCIDRRRPYIGNRSVYVGTGVPDCPSATASPRREVARAFLREEGGPLAVEGACVILNSVEFYINAFSLSLASARQLPPGGSLVIVPHG